MDDNEEEIAGAVYQYAYEGPRINRDNSAEALDARERELARRLKELADSHAMGATQ